MEAGPAVAVLEGVPDIFVSRLGLALDLGSLELLDCQGLSPPGESLGYRWILVESENPRLLGQQGIVDQPEHQAVEVEVRPLGGGSTTVNAPQDAFQVLGKERLAIDDGY